MELLSRKTYGLQVIQAAMRGYLFSGRCLRQAAREVPLPASTGLHHSTLWH
jgi:hypothetical protein